jgi:hypothetical protein
MKRQPQRVLLAGILAAFTAFTTPGPAQVAWQDVTNGLVDYYPLDTVLPGNVTPDLINRRDMFMVGMTSNNIVSANHPGINSSNLCLDFNQAGAGTIIYYPTTGQTPLTGAGDFLPFCNQRGATMNFWIKGNGLTGGSDRRFFGECPTDGQSDPLFLIGTSAGTPDGRAHFWIRDDANGYDSNGVPCIVMPDGTYQLPAPGWYWVQGNNFTTNNVLDGNWHMFTVIVDSNAVIQVYIDGVRDTGSGAYTDPYGESVVGPPLWTTNYYYTTNDYQGLGTNPPPNGFVRWMMNGIYNSGATAFGGFKRNNSIYAGVPCQIDDIAFWNRVLSSNEMVFVMTNGVPVCQEVSCSFCNPRINSFSANPSRVHPGESVTLQWNIQAITSKPIVSLFLSPIIGEVTNVTSFATGNGSTNVPVFTTTTFNLSLTNLNSCGYPVAGLPASATVIVVPLAFNGMSYLPSDPGNAGNPSFAMTWNSVTNHTYSVQRKLPLTGSWTTLVGGLPAAGNSTSFKDNTLGSSLAAFYRVTWP